MCFPNDQERLTHLFRQSAGSLNGFPVGFCLTCVCIQFCLPLYVYRTMCIQGLPVPHISTVLYVHTVPVVRCVRTNYTVLYSTTTTLLGYDVHPGVWFAFNTRLTDFNNPYDAIFKYKY